MSGRFVESSPSKELLDEATSEGDADPEEATPAGRAASGHRCQSAPRNVAFTAIILCTALLAIAFMRRPLPTQMVGDASVTRGISLTQTGVGDATIAMGTGCNNWKEASLDRWAGNADECVQSCRDTRGCVAANYQAVAECPTRPLESDVQGTCYLMNEECQQGPNECWAVYTLPEDSRMPNYFEDVTHGAGCKNMGTIGMGQEKMFSRFECQAKCSADPECDGFIHQQKGCVHNGDSFAIDGGDHDPHTCELFRGECVEDKSYMYACWEVYKKDPNQGEIMEDLYHFVEDATEGATTATLEHPECFRVGDTVQLFHEASDANHRYEITGINPITFSPALMHAYEAGTGVMRIHHPYNPKWCGDFPTAD